MPVNCVKIVFQRGEYLVNDLNIPIDLSYIAHYNKESHKGYSNTRVASVTAPKRKMIELFYDRAYS